MLKRAKYSLLRNKEEEGYEPKEINKKKAALLCLICLLLLVALIMALVTLRKHFKGNKSNHKHEESESKKYKQEKSYFQQLKLDTLIRPKNMSQLLEMNHELCKKVSDPKGGPGHIYIVKGEQNLTSQQACAIESILRLFPDRNIYLLSFNRHEVRVFNRCSASPNHLALLLYLYKDRLNLLSVDKVEFFKNTPIQNINVTKPNFVFWAMLFTAYRYGGFVVSPDVLMTDRDLFECFPEETIVEPFAVMASTKCDEFLHYLMLNYRLCSELENCTVETILSKAFQLYCKNRVASEKYPRRLKPHEICKDMDASCPLIEVSDVSENATSWMCSLAKFCKQVAKATLGIKMNQIEVEEETSMIKTRLRERVDSNSWKPKCHLEK